MSLKKRSFQRDFKVQVCQEIEAGLKTKAQATREHQLSEGMISKWLTDYQKDPVNCFTHSNIQLNQREAHINQLEAALGRTVLENQILKKTLTTLKKRSHFRRFTK